MRQSILLLVGSVFVLGALLSACGTKGPLTLTPTLPPKTKTSAPAQTTIQPATVPAQDANTVTEQH